MTNLITLTDPRSPAAEAYQSLRTNIEFSGLDQTLRSVLLTCADTTTDKSIAVANLAVVMAQAGDRVIVVDGDLRRPRQHEIFGLANQTGVSNWLENGGAAPLQTSKIDNLRILTSGVIPANPIALLSTKRLENMLKELSNQADYILVDAPPLLVVTDAALWASKADGVVLLVSAGGTRREHAQRAKAVLEKVRARIIGAVLLDAEKDTAMVGYGGKAD